MLVLRSLHCKRRNEAARRARMRHPTREIKGVSVDLGKELAKRLGVPYEQVEYQRVAEVVEALKSGAADFTITNASPARAKEVDFTQPLVSIELGFLVPTGSPLSTFADIDPRAVRGRPREINFDHLAWSQD